MPRLCPQRRRRWLECRQGGRCGGQYDVWGAGETEGGHQRHQGEEEESPLSSCGRMLNVMSRVASAAAGRLWLFGAVTFGDRARMCRRESAVPGARSSAGPCVLFLKEPPFARAHFTTSHFFLSISCAGAKTLLYWTRPPTGRHTPRTPATGPHALISHTFSL